MGFSFRLKFAQVSAYHLQLVIPQMPVEVSGLEKGGQVKKTTSVRSCVKK
jgi:hypothetical protein